MNKGDLVDLVAAQLGETKASASRAVDAVLASIARGVQQDEKVTIAGFGCFEKRQRAPRTGVNPATKERMEIGPSTTVAFRASQALKDTL